MPVAPRAARATAAVGLTAVPDPSGRLSDGVLLDASIQARLLGIRLLTIDAAVVLAPADIGVAAQEVQLPRRAPARNAGLPPRRAGAPGPGLAEAVRSIDEGAALLAQARRTRLTS